ncbi:helix-turn-helix domain-containing protein [Streptomyces sp. NPDC058459]|uniref:helix-turn-helix domain-containing protein n=1 Tax=Streptomyces sp. NPDC058459 TaxID=3346508 RepID=UPI00365F0576
MDRPFDTGAPTVRDRMEAWQAVTKDSLPPSVISVDRAEDFRASLRVTRPGAGQVTALTDSSPRYRRTPLLVRRSDPGLYSIGLIRRGVRHLSQAQKETGADLSDLVFYSTFTPFDARVLTAEESALSVIAQFPQALVPLPPSAVDALLGSRFSGRKGIGALLAQLLTQLARDDSAYSPADGARLGTVLLDLVTALLAHHIEAGAAPSESGRRAMFTRVRAFVEQHLGDAELAPVAIAAAHHISTRSLHRLFRDHGLTVAAYIRHQRLERSRQDLADPALATRPINTVATQWGFPHPETFSRAFRTAYGLAPRDYRHARLGHGAPDLGTAAALPGGWRDPSSTWHPPSMTGVSPATDPSLVPATDEGRLSTGRCP